MFFKNKKVFHSKEKLIEYMSLYKKELLTNEIIKFVRSDFCFSYDDIVSFLDEFFELMNDLNESKSIKTIDNLKKRHINKIINTIIDYIDYKPDDNPSIINRRNNSVMFSESHVNKRYNNKRKISNEYYKIGRSILYKHKEIIEKKLKIKLDDYYLFLENLTKYAFDIRIDKNYIELEKLMSEKKFENIIGLLERKKSKSKSKIYNFNGLLFCTDFFYFEENAFSIIEELLIEKDEISIYQKILKTKGKYLEEVVYDKLNLLAPSYKNIMINNYEIDVLSIVFNNLIIHVETKALKYDSLMKENKKLRNNCKNYVKRGIKQLMERDLMILGSKKIEIFDENEKIKSVEGDFKTIPILVTMDDVFDFSQFTRFESIESGLGKYTPLIINLDDFLYIIDNCRSIMEFVFFATVREINKMCEDNFYRDDLIYFLLNKKVISIYDNPPITSSHIRNQIFFFINKKRFNLEFEKMRSLFLSLM